ncbi:uncharacterized protein B0H64DRAFT_4982 [Chaetomium fimeti]|uniref:Secreted protein n=1 Tax=Chaetomium fimeti TaxID=1854472 RepID=A0AAE0HNX7_9PEZI|nr:hypothetical protein B0H64DRAFT_4982 [Chaetomium fimeti]
MCLLLVVMLTFMLMVTCGVLFQRLPVIPLALCPGCLSIMSIAFVPVVGCNPMYPLLAHFALPVPTWRHQMKSTLLKAEWAQHRVNPWLDQAFAAQPPANMQSCVLFSFVPELQVAMLAACLSVCRPPCRVREKDEITQPRRSSSPTRLLLFDIRCGLLRLVAGSLHSGVLRMD